MTDDAFRARTEERLRKTDPEASDGQIRSFLEGLHYLAGDYTASAHHAAIRARLGELDERFKTGGRFQFYLATPPALYTGIAQCLAEAGLAEVRACPKPWPRIVIEKPFGNDMASADALNQALHEVVGER